MEDILLEMTELDFVVVEGFAGSEHISRIVVAEKGEDAEKLADEYTIGFVGEELERAPTFDRYQASETADLVEEKAVMLPALTDCGDCGYDSCRDYVLNAIDGEAPKNGCLAMKGPVKLEIDGKRIGLKSFVEDLIGETVSGLVSSLKEGEGNKIHLEVEKNEG